ncbi:hypothetical protein DUNSADRAFT_6836 [Dunaliella salina]|uniref:Uncharacterized protein n=1 Tax=Dunaliella salina TaxID=3046 RepID=A0ABQ7GMM6_DUNSA|nr:hypothetical protein DUNSADRAFT_6836 [Dunaliella salina]|eukprot:KAF5835849.1 hypothetical protein DUNSADRAFT_6836 [Dunaliella salina]
MLLPGPWKASDKVCCFHGPCTELQTKFVPQSLMLLCSLKASTTECVVKAAGGPSAKAGIARAWSGFCARDPQAGLPPSCREGTQVIGMATLGTHAKETSFDKCT